VARAYQILSKETFRKAFDERGIEGVDELRSGGDGAGGAADGYSPDGAPEEENDDSVQQLIVRMALPLETAYRGGSVEAVVSRVIACPGCQGSGSASGYSSSPKSRCPDCEGAGGHDAFLQVGAVVLEQRSLCGTCRGEGLVRLPESICPTCRGDRLSEEQARVSFEVPQGAQEGERIVVPGQGHSSLPDSSSCGREEKKSSSTNKQTQQHHHNNTSSPSSSRGDAVLLVTGISSHPRFSRAGDDLLLEHRVPLRLALCGGVFELEHLSGQRLRLCLERGEVLAPGLVKCVPGEGMPKRRNPHLHGDLLVRFVVDFPARLPEGAAAVLDRVFQGIEEGIAYDTLELSLGADHSLDSSAIYLATPAPSQILHFLRWDNPEENGGLVADDPDTGFRDDKVPHAHPQNAFDYAV